MRVLIHLHKDIEMRTYWWRNGWQRWRKALGGNRGAATVAQRIRPAPIPPP